MPITPKVRYENHHLVVVVGHRNFFQDPWSSARHEQRLAVLDSAIEEIKRHVDDVWSVRKEFDRIEECPLCGRGWELDNEGLPSCCVEAIAEFKKEAEVVTV